MTERRARGFAGSAFRWVVRLAWGAGWLLAQRAADQSVMFGSSAATVRAYEESLPFGLAGAGLMLVAALARFCYRSWLSASWFALLPAVTVALFLTEARGEPLFWHLLCLVAAVGLLSWSTASDHAARGAGASAPRGR